MAGGFGIEVLGFRIGFHGIWVFGVESRVLGHGGLGLMCNIGALYYFGGPLLIISIV